MNARWTTLALLSLAATVLGQATQPSQTQPAAMTKQGEFGRPTSELVDAGKLKLIHSDDLTDTKNWQAELSEGGRVEAKNGTLTIDVPGGCTVWYKERLKGPVLIEYNAKVISAGGPNDRVSDLNCFWMATTQENPHDMLAHPGDGDFGSYDKLLTYYVGLGGNHNKTTRFRRYTGRKGDRPLLPENDLSDRRHMITPNATQRITLVADGGRIQYYRDHELLFDFRDDQPYTEGWFGLRTVINHMEISDFKVFSILKSPEDKKTAE